VVATWFHLDYRIIATWYNANNKKATYRNVLICGGSNPTRTHINSHEMNLVCGISYNNSRFIYHKLIIIDIWASDIARKLWWGGNLKKKNCMVHPAQFNITQVRIQPFTLIATCRYITSNFSISFGYLLLIFK